MSLQPIPRGFRRPARIRRSKQIEEPVMVEDLMIESPAERIPTETEKKVMEEVAEIKKTTEEEANAGFFKALGLLGMKRESVMSTSSEPLEDLQTELTVPPNSPEIGSVLEQHPETSTLDDLHSVEVNLLAGEEPAIRSPAEEVEAKISEERADETESKSLKISALKEELKKQLRGRKQKSSSAVVDIMMAAEPPEIEQLEVRRRYTIKAHGDMQKDIAYFQTNFLENKLPPPDPILLDSCGAYLDSGLVSPPSPDGGIFTIDIRRSGRRPASENLRIAKQVVIDFH